MKKAFTLIEMILVIVILAITSGMTLNMVLAVYKNYIQAESVERLSSQINLVLNQISKRLDYRIRDTTIARRSSDNKFISISDKDLDGEYDILEFIPYSYEAFNLGIYSGVADMDVSSSATGLVSPDSNLDSGQSLFSQLTNGKVNFNANMQTAMIFKGVPYNVETSFGYNGNISKIDISTVSKKNNTAFNIHNSFVNKNISEQYYLSHTAYALVVVDNGTNDSNKDFDLYLHYNYRPWLGERYNDANTQKTLLAKNVSRFKFKGYNGMMLLKLCLRDNQKHRRSVSKSSGFDFTLCRTKAVY